MPDTMTNLVVSKAGWIKNESGEAPDLPGDTLVELKLKGQPVTRTPIIRYLGDCNWAPQPGLLSPIEEYRPLVPLILGGHADYASLRSVLDAAYRQASQGKGKERHSRGEPFDKQPMQTISRLVGSPAGMEFQAIKKIQESTRMTDKDRRIHELLGAINYIAGVVVYLESEK